MNSEWMIGSSLVALLFATAALLLTRVAALYRRVPLRWFWLAASLASFAAAALWLRQDATRSSPPSIAARAMMDVFPPTVAGDVATTPVTARIANASAHLTLPSLPHRAEEILLTCWLVASAGLFLTLLMAVIRLVIEKKSWRRSVIAGETVLVSPTFGPAIVGLASPVIVVPQWVLALDEKSQRAIVVHEAEHLHAHDPVLVLAGMMMVILMPWNPGIWWNWRGLRRAIELDCDARVVAHGVECSEYANVLLGAWKQARGRWLPAAAFAERASGLGARVEHLMRPQPRRRFVKMSFGVAATAVLVMAACAIPSPHHESGPSDPYPLVIIDGVPRPELPPIQRFTGKVVAETTTTPKFEIYYRGETKGDSAAAKLYPNWDDFVRFENIAAPASEALFGPSARYGASLMYTKRYLANGGKIIAPGVGDVSERIEPKGATRDDMIASAIASIFRGITLSDAQKAQAHAIIADFFNGQNAVTALRAPMMIEWPKRNAVTAHRDGQLRQLLTNDADRAKFDEWLTANPMQTLDVDRYARMILVTLVQPNELDAERAAQARKIISKAALDENSLYERDPGATADRARIVEARNRDVRAIMSSSERAATDKLLARNAP